jgi:tripartite-type tricarboxylate transporter receptor subunit TctC
MTSIRRYVTLVVLSALAVVAVATAIRAQPAPAKLIKFVVPTTAGSPLDVMARLLTARLSATTGQTAIVENRAGAGTTIGSKAVSSSVPDGTTLLFTSVSHAVSAAMYRKLDYDPVKDFAPVAMVAESSWVLVISPTVPAKSVAELVAYAKSHPGKLNFGFGAGTAPHLLGEVLKAISGVDIVSVPYKGGAPAQADLLAGQIQMNFGTTATLLPFIESGKLRALAVTGNTRSPDLPDVPTMAESGFPHLAQGFWLGVLAPAPTPSNIVTKLNNDINASLNTPEVTASMAKLGFNRTSTTAKTFATYLAADVERWSDLVRKSGVKTN